MKHPPAAGAGLATAGASLPSVHVGGRIAAAAPLTGSVANPAGCRCAPPGGGAPGRRSLREEGSQPRARRPTRVELERGMLADCRYQPSRRRSVVVKQGVRTIEESRKGSVGAGHRYGSRAFQELSPPLRASLDPAVGEQQHGGGDKS